MFKVNNNVVIDVVLECFIFNLVNISDLFSTVSIVDFKR